MRRNRDCICRKSGCRFVGLVTEVFELVQLRVPCSEMHYVLVKDLENYLRGYGEVSVDLVDVSVVVSITEARSREIRWFELSERLSELVGGDLDVVMRGNRLFIKVK